MRPPIQSKTERGDAAVFGMRLDTMHASLRGVAHARGRGRREGEQDVSCWLFARREDAEAFAKAFGGTVLED